MRKLCVLALLCLGANAYATISVSGNLRDLTGTAVTSGTSIRFTVRGCNSNAMYVSGTALIAPNGGSTVYYDFRPDNTGAISGTLYSTSDISCAGTTNIIWYGMTSYVNGRPGPESAVSASANININAPTLLSSNPVADIGTSVLQGYVFTQASTSTTWTINHNLNAAVSVEFFDSSGALFWPNTVVQTTSNTLTATFTTPQSGTAVIHKAGVIALATGTQAILSNPGADQSITGTYKLTLNDVEATTINATTIQANTLGGLLHGRPITNYSITSNTSYNAFPTIAKMANGSLIMVYRKGTKHYQEIGSIVSKISPDNGRTWGNEATVYVDGTYDSRDPGVTVTAGGTVVVSFFRQLVSGADDSDAVYVIKSSNNAVSWGSPLAVGGFTAWNASSSPVVEAADGTWLQAVYGVNTLGNNESVKVMRSSNAGVSWSPTATIQNGVTDARRYWEPNLVKLANNNIYLLSRTDAFTTYSAASSDNGATFGASTVRFNAYGSPRLTQLSSGKLLVTYRSNNLNTVTGRLAVRTSTDSGVTWTSEQLLDLDPTVANSESMEYGGSIEVQTGLIGLVYSFGKSSSLADVRFLWLAETSDLPILRTATVLGVHSLGDINAMRDVVIYADPITTGLIRFEVAGSRYGMLSWDGVASPNIGLNVCGGCTGTLNFYAGNGTRRWFVNASGHFAAGTDNTYDMGIGGARPRDLNLGRNAVIAGTLQVGGGTALANHLGNSVTWDPANMAATHALATTTLTVTGVATDGTWTCSASHTQLPGNNVVVTAYPDSTNNVRVILMNENVGALDLASGTLKVDCWK